MWKSKVTSRGRVSLPREVRKRLALLPGDEVEFTEEEGIFRIRKQLAGNPFARWEGYAKHLVGRDPDELVREMRDP